MATIGKIDIAMGVTTTKLSKGLADSSSMLGGFGSSIAGVGAKVATFAAAGLGLGAAGMLAMAKSSLSSVDALNDQATQIGTTAGRLGELRYAAKLTGTEQEAFDAGLQKMTTNLGHAVRQGGPAAVTLGNLGLKVRDLAAMDPADAFLAISGAISKVPNPALQASAAMDLFGKGGAAMLNTIKAGPAEIGRLTEEAKRLGLSVSGFDAANIGAANDALDRMSAAFSGLGNTLAAAVAPYVTMVAEGIVDLATQLTNGEGTIGAWGATFAAGMANAVSFVRNFGSYWTIAQLMATEAFANILAILDTVPENFAIITEYIGKNWSALLVDMVNLYATYATNLLKNAGNLGLALWDAIQGKGFHFEVQPLLDGFKATADALPELIHPAVVSMDAEIGDEFRKITVNDEAAAAAAATAAAAANAPKKRPAGEAEVLNRLEAPKLAGIAEMGSANAYSAIAKFQAGEKGKGIDLVAKNTADSLAVQRAILDETKKKSGSTPTYEMA